MIPVFCIGELLIDWISTDIDFDLSESVHFIKKAGGAPANVAIAITRLGGKSSFAGCVGKDPFGIFLKNTLIENQVGTEDLIEKSVATTFAFVSIQKNGERDFVFYRGADEKLELKDIKPSKEKRLYHFGSATAFLSDPLLKTYTTLMENVSKENGWISFDPNFRTDLWKENSEQFIDYSLQCIQQSSFVKLSEEEALLIGNDTRLEDALQKLPLKKETVVCVTLGRKGTLLYQNGHQEIIPSIKVDTIDTTGAGDAFVGAMLVQFSKKEERNLSFEELREMVAFANKVAAISTTQLGAIDSLPTLNQLEDATS